MGDIYTTKARFGSKYSSFHLPDLVVDIDYFGYDCPIRQLTPVVDPLLTSNSSGRHSVWHPPSLLPHVKPLFPRAEITLTVSVTKLFNSALGVACIHVGCATPYGGYLGRVRSAAFGDLF